MDVASFLVWVGFGVKHEIKKDMCEPLLVVVGE